MPGYVALPAYRPQGAINFDPLNEGLDDLGKQLEKNRLLRQAQAVGAALAPDTATPATANPLMVPQNIPASPAQASAAAAGRDFPTSGTDYSPVIKGMESNGNYRAVGPITASGDRAYGAHQVMGKNIPSWTQEVLGQSLTPQQYLDNPDAQEKVFRAKFGQYVAKTGNPQDAASMWFTGKPLAQGANRQDLYGTTGNEYVRRFNAASGSAPAASAPSQAAPAPSGPNYRKAATIAFQQGNVALGTQLLQQQTELDNQAYTRSHQAQQEAIGEQHWQAGNTRAEASASREAQTFDEAQQKALEQKFGTIAQTIATEPDPAKQKGMVDQLLSSHPEIAPGLQKYGVPLNDPAAVTKFLLAEAQGIVPAQKPQFTQIGEDPFGNKIFGWADSNTLKTTPAQGSAPSAGPNPGTLHGEEYLKTVDPTIANQLKALDEGRMPYPGSFAMSKPYWQAMMRHISNYDPNFDETTWKQREATAKSYGSGGVNGKQITQLNTTIQHMAGTSDRINELGNYSFTPYNWLKNTASSTIGDPALKRFNSAVTDHVSELGKLLKMGVLSQHEHDAMVEQLDASGSPSQLHGVLADQAQRLSGRVRSLQDQRDEIMGPKYAETHAPLIQKQALEALGPIYARAGRGAPDKYGDPGDVNAAPAVLAGSVSIPQGAIDLLRKDPSPDAVKEFNDTFGSDAARGVLGR